MDLIYCLVIVIGVPLVDFVMRCLAGYFFKSWNKIVISVVDEKYGQYFLDEWGHLADLGAAKSFRSVREARRFVEEYDVVIRFDSYEILEFFNCHKKTGYRKSLP